MTEHEEPARPRAGSVLRRRTTLLRAAVLAALLALLLTGAAQAGTVSVSQTRLVFTDGAAEDNDLLVSLRDGALVVAEAGAGATMVAGEGCTVSASTATCRPAAGRPFSAATANLGDGANRAQVTASVGELGVTLNGGDGPDVLQGAAGSDRLGGGGGDDVLEGGDGDDVLFGDDGADQLEGGEGLDDFSSDGGDDVLRAADGVGEVLDCGAGADRAEADAADRANADCEAPDAAQPLPAPAANESFEETPEPSVAPTASGEVRSLRIRSRCFFAGTPVSRARRATCARPTRGSALLVDVTAPTAVVVGVQKVISGPRVAGRCFPRGGYGADCRLYVRAALLRRVLPAGTTAIGLSGRSPAALAPGLYRAAASTEVAGRPAGRPRFVFFRVCPRPGTRAVVRSPASCSPAPSSLLKPQRKFSQRRS